jgi:hypothetical protein
MGFSFGWTANDHKGSRRDVVPPDVCWPSAFRRCSCGQDDSGVSYGLEAFNEMIWYTEIKEPYVETYSLHNGVLALEACT